MALFQNAALVNHLSANVANGANNSYNSSGYPKVMDYVTDGTYGYRSSYNNPGIAPPQSVVMNTNDQQMRFNSIANDLIQNNKLNGSKVGLSPNATNIITNGAAYAPAGLDYNALQPISIQPVQAPIERSIQQPTIKTVETVVPETVMKDAVKEGFRSMFNPNSYNNNSTLLVVVIVVAVVFMLYQIWQSQKKIEMLVCTMDGRKFKDLSYY